MFQQSLQQWEWLIVNDASTDPAALAILDEYRRRDPRIRVIDNQVNQGLAGTRNVGFEAATTDYVFLLDDDDLMEPTAIEKFVCFLESYPEYAVVNGWSVAFGAMEYLWPTGFNRGAEMLKENFATGRALVRRTAHRAVGGYDASLRSGMEDWEFWLRLADHGLWGATIPEYCDWYRRHRTTPTAGRTSTRATSNRPSPSGYVKGTTGCARSSSRRLSRAGRCRWSPSASGFPSSTFWPRASRVAC